MNWLNRFWRIVTEDRVPLTVGTRVTTPHGTGVIVSASVCVDLDEGTQLRRRGGPRVNVTHQLHTLKV